MHNIASTVVNTRLETQSQATKIVASSFPPGPWLDTDVGGLDITT
jgi:hypothetical protein